MIKQIFTNQSRTITGAAIILGAASFISRGIGVVRDRIFAHQFGAGADLDMYYAAFKVPDLVYNLIIVGALSAGFIPVFMDLWAKDRKEAWRVTNGILNIFGIMLVLVCGILWIFTPYLMPYIVPGFSPEQINTTVMLTRIMFISPILLGLSGIVSSVLQSMKAFLIYSLTPIVYNLGIILGAIFLVPIFGIKGLAYGVLIGALLHLLIQLPSFFHHGFTYQFYTNFKNRSIRKIGKLMIPRTLSLAAHQVNILIITVLASMLATGSITVFNFANNLQFFAVGIVGYSFAIAAFPTLAKFVAEKQQEKLIKHLVNTIKQILFFIIPLTVIFLLLRIQIVRVVLGTGEFDWPATITTANTLAFFTLSFFAQCLIPLLSRAYYALHDTWTPFVIAVISVLINIIGSLLLMGPHGVAGLALAFSISSIIQVILLWVTLRIRKLHTLNEYSVFQGLYKMSTAALFMAVSIQFLKNPIALMVDMTRFWGIFTQGAIAGGVGILIYGFVCLFLRVEEMNHLATTLQSRWLKIRNIQGEINEADEI